MEVSALENDGLLRLVFESCASQSSKYSYRAKCLPSEWTLQGSRISVHQLRTNKYSESSQLYSLKCCNAGWPMSYLCSEHGLLVTIPLHCLHLHLTRTTIWCTFLSLNTIKKSEAKHRKAPSHPACKKNGKYEVIDKFACLSSVKWKAAVAATWVSVILVVRRMWPAILWFTRCHIVVLCM